VNQNRRAGTHGSLNRPSTTPSLWSVYDTNTDVSLTWRAQSYKWIVTLCRFRTSPPKDLPSPPGSARSKAEAFEDFKVGHGSKISRILKENKAVLRERHGLLQQLTEEVNAVKREIDFAVASIQQQQEEEEEEEEARRGRGTRVHTIVRMFMR